MAYKFVTREDVNEKYGKKCSDYEEHCPTCFVHRILDERDTYGEIAIYIETEWRMRETWVGPKRPEMITEWVHNQAARLLERGKEK